MVDKRGDFYNKYNFDFMEEFIIKQKNVYYFYLQCVPEEILKAPIQFVYGYEGIKFSYANNLEDLLKRINPKSELCEIVGVKQFCDNITKEFMELKDDCEITLPILTEEGNMQIILRLQNLHRQQLYLGEFKCCKDNVSNEMLFETSFKDAITGLFNRNALDRHIEGFENDNKTYGIMIDLDEFKAINDTYGHAEGDKVLSKVGEMLLGFVNSTRIFYRISGDEFFIQVKNAEEEDIHSLMEKINEEIQNIVVGEKPVTCSIGAVKFHKTHFSENRDLVRLADVALYRAKANGRNQGYLLSEKKVEDLLK